MRRRAFLAGALLAGCSRRDRAVADAPRERSSDPAPAAPTAAEASARARRGATRLEEWDLGEGMRAAVLVPTWGAPGERFPVLVALHGRGEAMKTPALGALGWPNDYALVRAIDRVANPPVTERDLEGFADPDRLRGLNRDLAARPFGGLVVACPYLPDQELRKPETIAPYARFIVDTLLPRVRRDTPALPSPAATGIDGVSLGGAVALRVGLGNPSAFGAVGSLQAAIAEEQAEELTGLARDARAKNPALALRLLTSDKDYFRAAIALTSRSLKAAGIAHEMVVVPGPHDYPFNRGPGAVEMLTWHDRTLARG